MSVGPVEMGVAGTGEGPPGHEGYPAAVLDDGAELSSWTAENERPTVGYRAVCACGWRGSTLHDGSEYPDEAGRARVMADWQDHARTISEQLERVGALDEPVRALAELRRALGAAVAGGATAPEVARALDLPEPVVEVLLG